MTYALGIISALVAPFLVVVGFIIWDNHWNGSAFSLNMYKCNVTAVGFLAVSMMTSKSFSPQIFTVQKVGALMGSSTIGILIGDWTWLEGLRLLGARKIIVMDSLKPFLAALVGNIFLGEELYFDAFFGLILTVVGVSLVGLEKETHGEKSLSESTEEDVFDDERTSLIEQSLPREQESYANTRKVKEDSQQATGYGLFMAISNVVLHTFGALITKIFGVGMTTFEINFIRFGFAGICMAAISLFMRIRTQNSQISGGEIEATAWYYLPKASSISWLRVSLGVCFVSFFQPALTNYAMFQIPLALLLTLESIGPLYSLPLSYVLQNDRPTLHACLGALLAVVGIVILSFRGMAH